MSFSFRKELEAGAEQLGIEIAENGYEPLESYYHQLRKWSKKVNLIAKATSEGEIVEKHFLDSLTLLPHLRKNDAHLLDIGTGAGFPGLVCKAAFGDDLKLTLVEPRLKRVSFLRHIIRTLQLDHVTVYAKRVEEVPGLLDVSFSHITCRAVTEISPFLEMVSGFSGSGAQLVCMKGPKWREELEQAGDVLSNSGYCLGEVVEHVLPVSKVQRAIVLFAKK